mgnify:CR=1 FL=1
MTIPDDALAALAEVVGASGLRSGEAIPARNRKDASRTKDGQPALLVTPRTTEEVAAALRAAGMRVDTDLRNEKINYKVREHSLAHVPLILAVGRRDMENRTVAVRRLGSEKQEVLELGAAVTKLSVEARPPF